MKVLVVQDEARLAGAVRRSLAVEGISVDVVHNGVDGLWASSGITYEVIMLDLMLPRLGGYRVVEQLRERGVWTPVLMLTADDGEHDPLDAFDLGADDYLTKPFSFVILVARLRALMRQVAPEHPPVLAAGDLTLDPTRRRVARGDAEIALTPREFGLLEFLLRHRGDVVSKAQILAEVWEPAHRGDPNVVEVYVSYLRRKVDVPFGRRAIQTVRGMGYRIAADG